MKKRISVCVAAILCIAAAVAAQTTEFKYQGHLQNSSVPANGNFDFEFALFDAATGGAQIGSTLTRSSVTVVNGIFAVSLDFGNGFPGASRYLEIRVRQSGGGGFTALLPRQNVASAPYAVKSITADNATVAATANTAGTATLANNSLQLGGVAANQFVQTGDPRLSDARPPTPGSANYVQNTASQQAASNFNVSGTGTANILNAGTQFNLGGNRILSNPGTVNLFAGTNAGTSNTTGSFNAFFGGFAGNANTIGESNSFFGRSAGGGNTTGSSNSFFGESAGLANTTGSNNAFFGTNAGKANTEIGNSFFGSNSGVVNSTGFSNSFFGAFSGLVNTSGSENTFIGSGTGSKNTTGGFNSFIGTVAGLENISGNGNTFVGHGTGRDNTTGSDNTFLGLSTGMLNTSGTSNSFLGRQAGSANIGGGFNTFIGNLAGSANVNGNTNSALGYLANVASGTLFNATAIGAQAIVTTSNRIQLGRDGTDTVAIGVLTTATATQLCINARVLSSCSSSRRYKENILPFGGGLDLIKRLQPVTFDWKGRIEPDVGFIAEEVGEVEPLLVTRNENGSIEGVKFDQFAAVFVNAIKAQQLQIEAQEKQLAEQAEINKRVLNQLELLTKIVCRAEPSAEVCKDKE